MFKFSFAKYSILILLFFQACEIDTYTLTKDYLLKCQLNPNECGPIIIKRETSSDKIIISFILNPENLLLGLYNSSTDSLTQPAMYKYLRPLRKGFIYIKNRPALELTNLPDSEYYIRINNNEVRGVYRLLIETNKK